MTIVLPSMGRCGSTALFYAIRASIPPHAGIFVARLSETKIEDGEIIKTHDIAPDELPEHWKVIYTHGDIDAIRRSIRKQPDEWRIAHFAHLGLEYVDETSIDELDLQPNMESWKQHDNVLFIHYDELFESEDIISKFLGVEITLPKRKQRTS